MPALRRVGRITRRVIALGATILAFSSYFRYTTAGLDFETTTPQGVDVTYYRLRWDDGSVWVGMAVQPVPRPQRPLDWADPGGTLFARTVRPRPATWANRLGFWIITDPRHDPYMPVRYAGAKVSRWAALPSWLFLGMVWSRSVVRWGKLLLGRANAPVTNRKKTKKFFRTIGERAT